MSTKTNKKSQKSYFQMDKQDDLFDPNYSRWENHECDYVHTYSTINDGLPINNKSEIIKSYY